jgi:hypothetical protein
MTQQIALYKCPACDRVLLGKSERYARERHEQLMADAAAETREFVREATWPAFLASMKRCRCGSKRRLMPVDGTARVGQLRLQLDGVVIQ